MGLKLIFIYKTMFENNIHKLKNLIFRFSTFRIEKFLIFGRFPETQPRNFSYREKIFGEADLQDLEPREPSIHICICM